MSSNLVKQSQLGASQLQEWGIPSSENIEYYDGSVLVVSGKQDDAFPVAAKAGTAGLFGIAIFMHAPAVAAVFWLYAAYKVVGTVKQIYGGGDDLAAKIAEGLGLTNDEDDRAFPSIPKSSKLTAQDIENYCLPLYRANQSDVSRSIIARYEAQKNSGDHAGAIATLIGFASLDQVATSMKTKPENIREVYDWAMNSTTPQLSKTIGAATRLTAVDVEKEETIAQFVDRTPAPRNVESAIAQAQSAPTKTKLSRQQVLDLPLQQRASHLMNLLAESGCDLRKLAGRPTLSAGGLQRSGKTTLIILLAILEKAMGQKIFYITRDTDLYPVSFDGYAAGSTSIAVEALMGLSDRINGGQMGALTGETWILDEFSSTAKEMPETIRNQFWGMALTGFAKQGGRVRFIVHHKTAKANGIPSGEAETFKAEVKMFWTDRTELETGTYQPSGQYELLAEVGGYYKETGEHFDIPQWLLTDTNPNWHNAPCPVRSLLQFFPEFDTRKDAIAHPLATKQSARNASPFADHAIAEEITPSLTVQQKLDAIAADFQSGSVSARSLVQSLGVQQSEAVQLLQMFALRNKAIARYDNNTQKVVRCGI